MRYGHWTAIVGVLMVVALRPSTAAACSCGTLCAAASEADAIFEATVVSVETEERPNFQGPSSRTANRVRLQDLRAWRGHPRDVVFTGVGGGDCGYDFRAGARYVIVANRSPDDGQLWTSICSMTQPLEGAMSFREYVRSLSDPSKGGQLWGRIATPSDGRNAIERATPVAGARVSVSGPVSESIATDPDGQYGFAELPPGDYTVSVAMPPSHRELAVPPSQRVRFDRAYACAVVNFWPRLANQMGVRHRAR